MTVRSAARVYPTGIDYRRSEKPSALRRLSKPGLLAAGLLLILVLSGFVLSRPAQAQESSFSNAKLLSSPQEDALRPRIAQSGDDTFVVWRQGADIVFKKIGNQGNATGSANINLSRGSGYAQSEPEIAASGEYVYVVWCAITRVPDVPDEYQLKSEEVWMAVSEDGGDTFGAPQQISQTPRRTSWFPRVAASQKGVAVIWEEPGTGEEPGIHVYRSMISDDGTRAGRHDRLGAPRTHEKYDIAMFSTHIYAVWTDREQSPMRLNFSRADGGHEFLTDAAPLNSRGAGDPHIEAVASDVHVLWLDAAPGGGRTVRVASSNNYGETFRKEDLGETSGYETDLFVFADNVYAAWQDGRDTFLSNSKDAGRSFGGSVRVGPGGGGIKVRGDGENIFLAWDRSLDADSVRLNSEVFVAVSKNDGSSFTVHNATETPNISFAPALARYSSSFGIAWTEFTFHADANHWDTKVWFRTGSLTRDLELLDANVVQAPLESDTLAAGKPTAVRVEYKNGFPHEEQAVIRLAYRNGTAANLTEEFYHRRLKPGSNELFLPPFSGPEDDFLRPNVGSFELSSVDIDVHNAVDEIPEDNNSTEKPKTYTVKKANPFRVLFVPIQVKGQSKPTCSKQLTESSKEYINGAFPIDDRDTTFIAQCDEPILLENERQTQKGQYKIYSKLDALTKIGSRPENPVYDKVVGIVQADWFWKYGPLDDGKAWRACGTSPRTSGKNHSFSAAIIEENSQTCRFVSTVAHELSHNMGWVDDANSTINPKTNEPSAHFEEKAPGYWVQQGLRMDSLTDDFMASSNSYALEWISTRTYQYLLDTLSKPPVDPPVITLGGIIWPDGRVEAEPWYSIDSFVDVELDNEGEYSLEYLDASGNVIAHTGFDGSSNLGHDLEADFDMFSVRVPDVSGTEKLVIKRGDEVLYERTRSPNSPQVKITGPTGGQTFKVGDTVDLTWDASDPDGDALHSVVSISTDEGESWIPLATDVAENHLSITATSDLVTDKAMIRVVTTDGLNTTVVRSQATFSISNAVENGKIAFVRSEVICCGYEGEGKDGLWTINPDGTGATRIVGPTLGESGTVDYFYGGSPSWSPDGGRIAFVGGYGNRSGSAADWGLWVTNADGSERTLINELKPSGQASPCEPPPTDIPWPPNLPPPPPPPDECNNFFVTISCPDWSPDGKSILVLGSETVSSDDAIYILDADGTNPRKVMADVSDRSGCPQWSPDGSRILLWSDRWDDSIYVINADGTGRKQLTTNGRDPVWSPDGTRIAFARSGDIWTMNADGSGQINIHDNPDDGNPDDGLGEYDSEPVWSPDGTQIAYRHLSSQNTYSDALWIMNATGSGSKQLTPEPEQQLNDFLRDSQMDWQPLLSDSPTAPTPTVTANAGGPYTGEEGSTITLDASKSSAESGNASYAWDLDGNGDYDDATGPTAEASFAENGSYSANVMVTDETGQFDTEGATINVENADPEVSDLTVSVDEDVTASLSARITDPGSQDTHEALVDWGDGTSPEPATLVLGSGGASILASHSYAGSGSYQVTVEVTDDDGGSGSASASTANKEPNRPPTLQDEAVTTDQAVPVEVTMDASDPEGDRLTYEVDTPPEHGMAIPLDDQSPVPGTLPNLIYLPHPNYSGVDSFTVRASDGKADSEAATVSVAIQPTAAPSNEKPVADDDTAVTDEDAAVVIDVRDGDTPGPDNESDQKLTVEAVTDPARGSAEIPSSGEDEGKVRYAPDDNYNGQDYFEYIVCDDGEPKACDEAMINVDVIAVNDEPGAERDSAETEEDKPVIMDVLANDRDVDGDALSVKEFAQGTNGKVSRNDGLLRYEPKVNFYGTDSFEYTAEDGHGGEDTAQVEIKITPVNDAPTADARGPYETKEGGSVEVNASGSDPEGKVLTYEWDLDGDGSFEAAGQNPTFSAVDLDGPSGHTVRLRVTDPEGLSASDEAAVNVGNVAPGISRISGPLEALTGKTISFTGEATDPSKADTSTGFSWRWSVGEDDFSPGPNPFTTSFSTCGDHAVSATAEDKDGGVSEAVGSAVVSVYEAHFRPPLDEGVYNTVEKGRIVPVKISIGCGGVSPELKPAIQLLKGDRTAGDESGSDAVDTYSSSAADTTGVMREVDGGYIYNLRVPTAYPDGAAVKEGDLLTVRVRPFGDEEVNMYVVLKIK